MACIVWRSWSSYEAAFELERIEKLPLQNKWVNGHKIKPNNNDIYLTTNGYDYMPYDCQKVSLYAESYVYLKSEYDNWDKNQNKWTHRFHFNPYYCSNRCTQQGIGTWWKNELSLFENLRTNKTIKYCFGMVLGNKGVKRSVPCDIGYIRTKIVNTGMNRSFKYYGSRWPHGDKNYGGECYIDGSRGSPVKFHDARRLMGDSKFVFAIENTYDKRYSVNYLTEKIWHGFLSCSVPIYLGAWNVQEIIPPDIFIDFRKFEYNPTKVMDYCEKMSDIEYNGYLDRIDKFLHGDGLKFSCEERFIDLDMKLSTLMRAS